MKNLYFFSNYDDEEIVEGDDENEDSGSEGDNWSIAGAEKDFDSDFAPSDNDDEARDRLGEFPRVSYPDDMDETKSHFTEYSLSSSVIRRNKNLSTLDEQFQAMFIKEYNEEQIGALDGEDIDGYLDENSALYKEAVQHTRKQLSKEASIETDKEWIVKWIQDMESKIASGQIKNDETEEIQIEEKDPDKNWDCQSILSTYSNIYNRPKILDAPKKILIDPITQMPKEPTKRGLTKKALASLNDDSDSDTSLDAGTLVSTISAISIRPPGETPEERRERKCALKELRKERRIEKKMNKSAFKDEKKRQVKINLNKRHTKTVNVV